MIMKQNYCLSNQKIAKSLFFVLTCDAPSLYNILNGHPAFSSKNTPKSGILDTFLKQMFICRLVIGSYAFSLVNMVIVATSGAGVHMQ